MNKVEELVQQLCPDGVPYKSLGSLGHFYGGLTGKSKEDFKDGNAKFITYKNVYGNPSLNIDVSDRVKIGPDEKQHTLLYGDIIFTGSSETPDECGMSSVVTKRIHESMYLNSFCFIFRFDDVNIMLPDFSKHLFRSSALRYQIGKTASGVTRYNVSKKMMANVKIPIPPLEIQREIVRILDNFTELTTELTAELTARKKQYEYYRNRLLAFDVRREETANTIWKTLGEICSIISGFPFDSSSFCENGIRLLRGMNVKRGYLDFSENNNRYWNTADGLEKFLLNAGDIVIAMDGSLVGKSFGVVTEQNLPLLLVQRVARVRVIEGNPRYIYHCIANRFSNYVDLKKTEGAVPHISLKDISCFSVPFPNLDVQNRLAATLDNFETICSDLNIGLPAEIEARQKQYEYYRDKLLTFKPLA